MLLFYENLSIDDNSIEVLKNPVLSEKLKRELNALVKDFTPTQMRVDSDFESLFMGSSTSDPNFLETYKSQGKILYVLIKDSAVSGFCLVNPNHPMIRNSFLVHYFLISEKERGKGLGKKFLSEVLQDLKMSYPSKHAVINVLDRNAQAKRLYLSLGFRPASLTMIKF